MRSARFSRSPRVACARISTRRSIRCLSPTAPRSRRATFCFKLDARQAEAQLKGAQAQLAKDQAQLEQNKRDVARYTDLVARSATPILNLDNAKTAVATTEAAILGDQAAIENLKRSARLVYDYSADFGPRRHGRHQGGQYRQDRRQQRGWRPWLAINQISPIYVSFSVTQTLVAGDPRSDGRTAPRWSRRRRDRRRARKADSP